MRFATQSRIHVRRGMMRFALFAFLWWVLTEGAPTSWGLGIPTVVAATWISLILSTATSWRWRLRGIAHFLPFFLLHSFIGSLDVARRAFQQPLPLHPVLVTYAWRLPPGPARIFFANTANLLPGTLSVELQNESLTMHVIDGNQPHTTALQALESQVATLFGLPLMPVKSGKEC